LSLLEIWRRSDRYYLSYYQKENYNVYAVYRENSCMLIGQMINYTPYNTISLKQVLKDFVSKHL